MCSPSALDRVCLNAENSDVRERQERISVITGAIPSADFISDENLGRILAAAKNVDVPGVNQL